VDIRPSTPHQVGSHQESLRLQDASGAPARPLGWPAAASATHREGFHPLGAQGTLARGGLILSDDVPRLSRHGSAWYPRLARCGSKGCVIADGDGMDDPATVHGRRL